MPTLLEYNIVKQQIFSYEMLGYVTAFNVGRYPNPDPMIEIINPFDNKSWRFCDPDWGIVSQQLGCLYKTLKVNNEKNKKPNA